MQKKIIALAIAAAFAAPVAMADVTVYGTMDGGVRHQTNDSDAAGGTTDSLAMGQYNTARWGFKSVEDMGDGLKTNVVLETSYQPAAVGAPGTNAKNPYGLIFDRQATIGMSGGWGAFDMGWNYTTSFKVIKSYDPMDYKYLSVAGAKTSDVADRAGNVVYSNKFGDVTVMAEYDMNDSSPTSQPTIGAARAVGVIYKAGAVNVGAAYTAKEDDVGGADNAMTHVTAGAGFDFGGGKVSVGYAKKATKNLPNDTTDTNMWLGGSFQVSSAMEVSAAYYSNAKNSGAANAPDSTKKTMMVSLTYDLSKKTRAYVELDKATANSGAANALDVVTSGSMVGLSTAF